MESKFVQTYPNVLWRLHSMNNRVEGKPTRIGIEGGFIERIEEPYSLPTIEINKRFTRKELERLKAQFKPSASRFSPPDVELRPENTHISSRVLAKISLELLYLYFSNVVFSSDFDTVRNHAIGSLECNVEFIPYAWKVHTGRPFIHHLLDVDKKWEIGSDIYAYFTLPGVQYLYPLTHPLDMEYFASMAERSDFKVVWEGQRIRNVYSVKLRRA